VVILYRIALFLYFLGARVAAPFSKKISLFVSGRKGLMKKIAEATNGENDIIWFHCPSVGEFEQARPIIERYRQRGGSSKILLTFFSPSGYELRKNYKHVDWVFYLPMDSPARSAQFLDIVKPSMAVFAKYDYWYYYLTGLKKRGVPTYIISAIFREEQPFFRSWGGMWREMLKCFTTLYVQDEGSAKLLQWGDFSNVVVAGDTRFDRVNDIVSGASGENVIVGKFVEGKRVMVAGSTWGEDEQKIKGAIQQRNLSLVLAPHEVYPDHISDIESLFSDYKVVRYTANPSDEQLRDADILVIDCIGLLSSLYRYGEFAYIGGGFGAGIHNILEAATYGKGVIFGPKYRKFKEAVDLVNLGGAVSFTAREELDAILDLWMGDASHLENVSKISKNYVQAHQGASDIFLKNVFGLE
jgi:3-deoxy-D-manno-octulosonic-acid transferase